MSDCIFCKIVKGELPSYKIYEDENTLAFLDIRPYTLGHTMVIPKKHYRWVWDIPTAEIGEFFQICQKIFKHYQDVSGDQYVNSFVIGKLVEHAHFHLVPNVNEGFDEELGRFIESQRKTVTEEDLKSLCEKYRLN